MDIVKQKSISLKQTVDYEAEFNLERTKFQQETLRASLLQSEITTLRQQVAQYKADAERLDWMIKKQRIVIEDSDGTFFTYNSTSGKSGASASTPRESIDSALAGKVQP